MSGVTFAGMHRIRRISLLALALAITSACLITGGAAAAPQKCVVELRVNVFATSPGGNWALQGALNAGRWRTCERGRAAAVPSITSAAAGPTVPPVRSPRSSAGAFPPASGRSAETGRVPPRSRRSRRLRARLPSPTSCASRGPAACTRIGTWRNDIAGTLKLTTTWTIEAGGAAQEAGGGAVSGTATLDGPRSQDRLGQPRPGYDRHLRMDAGPELPVGTRHAHDHRTCGPRRRDLPDEGHEDLKFRRGRRRG